MHSQVVVSLPKWVVGEVGDPNERYESLEDRMRLAVRLAERNVAEGTGGPFGACVFEIEGGRLVSVGVNTVVSARCSVAHAEIVAIMLAQHGLRVFDLGAPGVPKLDLVSTAQPCIQCFGAIWWSGISRLVVGASAEDVESLTGFREGPVPVDWVARLGDRAPLPPVEVVTGCLRDRARRVLRRYRESGGRIYNPGSGRIA